MERMTTFCSVLMPEDTRVVSKGMVGTTPVGVEAAAEVGRGGKNYMSMSRKSDDRTSASGEENSKPLIGRTPIAGDVGRKDASDPCLNRRSAKDAKGPGTGLTFAHP